MTFDKAEHKQIIQELISKANFPGGVVEAVYDLKKAVETATIAMPALPASHEISG
jgi:hypothetical protein